MKSALKTFVPGALALLLLFPVAAQAKEVETKTKLSNVVILATGGDCRCRRLRRQQRHLPGRQGRHRAIDRRCS